MSTHPQNPSGSPKPVDPRKVIDANHRGLGTMGWLMTLEAILLTIAGLAAYLYKHFH